jgi:hypothetical protein
MRNDAARLHLIAFLAPGRSLVAFSNAHGGLYTKSRSSNRSLDPLVWRHGAMRDGPDRPCHRQQFMLDAGCSSTTCDLASTRSSGLVACTSSSLPAGAESNIDVHSLLLTRSSTPALIESQCRLSCMTLSVSKAVLRPNAVKHHQRPCADAKHDSVRAYRPKHIALCRLRSDSYALRTALGALQGTCTALRFSSHCHFAPEVSGCADLPLTSRSPSY